MPWYLELKHRLSLHQCFICHIFLFYFLLLFAVAASEAKSGYVFAIVALEASEAKSFVKTNSGGS
jgi:hypothetical protein